MAMTKMMRLPGITSLLIDKGKSLTSHAHTMLIFFYRLCTGLKFEASQAERPNGEPS